MKESPDYRIGAFHFPHALHGICGFTFGLMIGFIIWSIYRLKKEKKQRLAFIKLVVYLREITAIAPISNPEVHGNYKTTQADNVSKTLQTLEQENKIKVPIDEVVQAASMVDEFNKTCGDTNENSVLGAVKVPDVNAPHSSSTGGFEAMSKGSSKSNKSSRTKRSSFEPLSKKEE
ncbi:unnamed protein product [Bursaphelenchus okinawaensis]|uniref:Uncharacterized protein n=1 Tax=Bursaphelenchus okinawaensis TaxID=465554 RepID=A0A811LPQ5_9BILA|nr:unnamed protein product [Bursaphelenchus okinawaensis]CAG9127684.1 unnamed protein product [Bursaphelenchus okinawaensis]